MPCRSAVTQSGSPVVPRAVADARHVARAYDGVSRRVVEAVGHEAVVLRAQARHDGVVVGEGLGRKRGNEPRRAHAAPHDAHEVGRGIAVEVVVAKPVEGHHHHGRRVLLRARVDAPSAARGRRRKRRGRRAAAREEGRREEERRKTTHSMNAVGFGKLPLPGPNYTASAITSHAAAGARSPWPAAASISSTNTASAESAQARKPGTGV